MIRTFILIMLLCFNANAQEVITSYDNNTIPVLNEELRNTRSLIKQNETAIIPTSRGGFGYNISSVSGGSLFYATGSGSVETISGTSGQYLMSNGTSAPSFSSVPLGYTNMQVFTTSGTWTRPAGVNTVYVKALGAGGGGGYCSGTNGCSASGGGSGAYAEGIVSVSGNINVTVCASTAGGTSGSTTGTHCDSSFSTLVVADGGYGGVQSGSGGAPGTVANSTGTLKFAGSSYGQEAVGTRYGGTNYVFAYGQGGISSGNASGYGAGGGGGYLASGMGGDNGGNGSGGLIIVYWTQ